MLSEKVIPRTNYQRVCEHEIYDAQAADWGGRRSTSVWRVIWRRMTQPGLERSVHLALLPPGPTAVGTTYQLALKSRSNEDLAFLAGLAVSIPLDYMVKISGRTDLHLDLVGRWPIPSGVHLRTQLLLRVLRLNCLTADYASLWEELFDARWRQDGWTDQGLTRVAIGGIDSVWTMDTPLRRDRDRWQALVEIDALVARMLGLSADQLCAMYRTQFGVLRKYEHKMVFDAEGRKICGHHHGAGSRQRQIQNLAKAGELSKEWTNLWKLYEQFEADPTSVDWLGHYTPPFIHADREFAMRRAWLTFADTEAHAEIEG